MAVASPRILSRNLDGEGAALVQGHLEEHGLRFRLGVGVEAFEGDPAVQLFDMRADPWEMRNLAGEARCADLVRDHRRLLDEWNHRMDVAPAA